MAIKFCKNNEGSAVVFKRLLRTHPELDIIRKKCVKSCGTCSSTLFAVLDGNVVRGASSEELFQKIQNELDG